MARAERTFRTPAIILKRRDFGEADRLLTLLTPHHGKLDAVAKGARKPTSSKTGHVELFTEVDMLIARGRELGIVTQAQVTEPHLVLREELSRGAYANYAAELLDRFTTVGDDDFQSLYTLLASTLQRLCTAPDPRLVIRYYEIHLLDIVGFRPELHECVFTHETIQPEDQYFSYAEGGVVTPQAARHAVSLAPVSMLTLKLLRHMQRSPFRHVSDLKVPASLHNDLERVMLGYITYLLEQRLQSVDFIRRIRGA
jgi:DNA repair protein RecO (recombination protein O)